MKSDLKSIKSINLYFSLEALCIYYFSAWVFIMVQKNCPYCYQYSLKICKHNYILIYISGVFLSFNFSNFFKVHLLCTIYFTLIAHSFPMFLFTLPLTFRKSHPSQQILSLSFSVLNTNLPQGFVHDGKYTTTELHSLSGDIFIYILFTACIHSSKHEV